MTQPLDGLRERRIKKTADFPSKAVFVEECKGKMALRRNAWIFVSYSPDPFAAELSVLYFLSPGKGRCLPPSASLVPGAIIFVTGNANWYENLCLLLPAVSFPPFGGGRKICEPFVGNIRKDHSNKIPTQCRGARKIFYARHISGTC